MPKKYDPDKKARVMRMVREQIADSGSVARACELVGAREGVSKDTIRGWLRRDTITESTAGTDGAEDPAVKQLKARVRSLEEENAILRSAATFFAGELDPRRR